MRETTAGYQKSIRQSTEDWVKDFLKKHEVTTLDDVPISELVEEMQGNLEELDAELFMVDCRKDYLSVLMKAIEAH